jgi:hypothetical protein
MKQRQPRHRQLDLFAPRTPSTPIAVPERSKLLPLISTLLSESLDVLAMTEVSDEDHR